MTVGIRAGNRGTDRGDGRNAKGQFVKGQPQPVGKTFKPGQSGNPAGRPPKEQSITAELRRRLDMPVSKVPQFALVAEKLGLNFDVPVREVTVVSMLMRACLGDAALLIEVWNRSDGKVAKRSAGGEGGPMVEQTLLNAILEDPDAMSAATVRAERLSITIFRIGQTDDV